MVWPDLLATWPDRLVCGDGRAATTIRGGVRVAVHKPYFVTPAWKVLLADLGVFPSNVLRRAELPGEDGWRDAPAVIAEMLPCDLQPARADTRQCWSRPHRQIHL